MITGFSIFTFMFFIFEIYQYLSAINRNPDFDISVDKLRSGAGGVSFENEAAVCRGTNVTCTRACFPSFYALFDGFVRLVFISVHTALVIFILC